MEAITLELDCVSSLAMTLEEEFAMTLEEEFTMTLEELSPPSFSAHLASALQDSNAFSTS